LLPDIKIENSINSLFKLIPTFNVPPKVVNIKKKKKKKKKYELNYNIIILKLIKNINLFFFFDISNYIINEIEN